MATQYGVTLTGFVLKQQQDIITEINSSLTLALGQNINLLPSSVFGQLVGIFSEREALIWQVLEAIYASQYPNGCEGTSVDNLLAFNALKRNKASPTVTNNNPVTQTNLVTLYGLLLFGTPGTVIPVGSSILTNLSPPSTLTTDASVTIGSAVDAIQTAFFSSVPGAFSIQVAGGGIGPSIKFNALANQTQITWSVAPTTGQFKLTLNGSLTTAFINWNDTAATIQAAIQLLAGYSGVTVTGSIPGGLFIVWGAIPNPITTITSSTLDNPGVVTDSVQAGINSVSGFSEVTVSGTFGTGFSMSFVGSLGGIRQPISIVNSSSLMTGSTVVNIQILNTQVGFPACAVATATCTSSPLSTDGTGPTPAPAGSMIVIGSPVSGWGSVNNELDAIPGSNVENDTQAIVRRANNLTNNSNGPLPGIVSKVSAVANVIQAVGYENTSISALQQLTFSDVPTAGQFVININGSNTASIPHTATYVTLQAAIRLLTGFSDATVIGNFTYGFIIDWGRGGRTVSLPLLTITSNTLSSGSGSIVITPAFNRDPKSFEIVATGGIANAIATAIYGAKPAGIETYGNTSQNVYDTSGISHPINFSRPTEIPFYVAISLVTDLYNIPGDPTSGLNPNSKFSVGSVQTIQNDIVSIGNAVGIGGLVIGFGSNGLIGAFNLVAGIVSYTMSFGVAPGPVTSTNVQMLPTQQPVFESFNVLVSYA